MTGGTSGRLVGRDAVLAMARAAVADAFDGAGALLLVSGEPGIGKTALLDELAEQAQTSDRPATVLRGSCWDGAGSPPYWPWVQVLRAAAEGPGIDGLGVDGLGVDGLGVDGLGVDGLGVDRSRLLGASRGPGASGESGQGEAADAEFRLYDGITRLITGMASRGPLLIVLDDLHWADEPSLRLLEFVVRQVRGSPVSILAAYRDAEAGPALRRLTGAGQLIPLSGLAQADALALMAAVGGPSAPLQYPPAELAARVWRRSGGNPFFIRELTRLLIAQGGWDSAAGVIGSIPDTVRDTLDRRLARLSQPCADLLAVSALAGPEIRPELLARVLPDPERIPELLAEAVRARVLNAAGDPADGAGRFAHDLFRESIVDGLGPTRRGALHISIGRALESLHDAGAPVEVGEIAVHLAAAGSAAVAADAVRYSVFAAEQATARLGHEDACRHYERALRALDLADPDSARLRVDLMLALAAARDRAGQSDAARTVYRRVAERARLDADGATLARAAIGTHQLGGRSAAGYAETIALLTEAAAAVPVEDPALRVRVLASLAGALHHSGIGRPDRVEHSMHAAEVALEAVELARRIDQPAELGFALLALHDVRWAPDNGPERLGVLAEMRDAAQAAGDAELLAQTHLLRAAALLGLGEPEGRSELLAYIQAAEQLGHARGRWGALTRRATLAGLAGKLTEATRLSEQGFELGLAIGQPDARGCFASLRGSLMHVGGPALPMAPDFELDDPLRPVFPLLRAMPEIYAGDVEAAGRELLGFTVSEVADDPDLEMLAIMAVAFAGAGSPGQRRQAYQRIRRYAGLHVIVGGCASYHGAVDAHLGLLAAALGETAVAIEHLMAAHAMHERIGATAWAARTATELDRLRVSRDSPAGKPAAPASLRLDGGIWTLTLGDGAPARLPDAKGLHDLATLVGAAGRDVHVFQLLGRNVPATGSDPVLDERAKAMYKARLAELDEEIDEAVLRDDEGRAARARAERSALVAQLTAAAGLGGRDRRLGDETERARKTVTARIRSSLDSIGRVHPELADHLRASVSTGTFCRYDPQRG